MSNEVDMPVRQAGKYLYFFFLTLKMKHTCNIPLPFFFVGVIYLKNLISANWAEKEEGPTEFNIHEQDRAMIRDTIVDAVVHAPEIIRQVAISVP